MLSKLFWKFTLCHFYDSVLFGMFCGLSHYKIKWLVKILTGEQSEDRYSPRRIETDREGKGNGAGFQIP